MNLHGSVATSINDCGEIVGYTTKLVDGDDCGSRGFLWTICDTLEGVPCRQMWRLDLLVGPAFTPAHESAAWSINNAARIGGGLRWGGGTVMIPAWWDMLQQTGSATNACDLGEFDSSVIGSQPGTAYGVSFPTAFDLVGALETGSTADAFAANPSAGSAWTILATPDARALGVVDIGSVTTIVGKVGTQAVVWQEAASGHVPTVLSVPPSSGLGSFAEARAINFDGEIVGTFASGPAPLVSAAIYWPSQAAVAALLPSGNWDSTRANSITASDSAGAVTVAGSAFDQSIGAVWFRRSGGGPWSSALASELQCGLPSVPGTLPGMGGSIREFHDVNSSGWMVGEYQPPDASHARAVLLVPMSCQADLSADGFVDAADLAALGIAWGACVSAPCPSDLTGDGFVDAQDMARLLLEWGRDCRYESFCDSYSCEARGTPRGEERAVSGTVLSAIGMFGFAECGDFCEWLDELPEDSSCCVRQMLYEALEAIDQGGE
jgi:hypothetical protein